MKYVDIFITQIITIISVCFYLLKFIKKIVEQENGSRRDLIEYVKGLIRPNWTHGPCLITQPSTNAHDHNPAQPNRRCL